VSGSNLILSAQRSARASESLYGLRRLLLVFGVGYPALLFGSLYTTWFVAWAWLGHMPRPGLDDPKYIGLLVDIPYWVTGLLLMGMPGAFLLSVVAVPVLVARQAAPGARFTPGLFALSANFFLWVMALWFLRADPWEVAYWYMD